MRNCSADRARVDQDGSIATAPTSLSRSDAQRYRLGVNHQHIPVNAAHCPVHSYHRDGTMRVDGNHGSTLGYEPNSYGEPITGEDENALSCAGNATLPRFAASESKMWWIEDGRVTAMADRRPVDWP